MSDYSVLPGDERTPLMRAFVAAFEHATNARAAIERSAGEPLDPAAHADALAEQLAAATRRLAREAMAWTGAAGELDIAAAQYAFVALQDELLLFSDWPGSAAWEERPLEMRVFGTRAAGERLPDAIEALLARRDPSQRDLANVYLACLTLGFKGRLRGEAGALRHDQLRHALFAFAMQRDAEPARLAASLERTAVAPRRAVPLTQMFPDVARFVLMLAVGLCALIGVSHLLWMFATAPVRPALDQFEAVSLADTRHTTDGNTSVSGVVLAPPATHANHAIPASTASAPAPQQDSTPDMLKPAAPAVQVPANGALVVRTAVPAQGDAR